MAGYGLGVVCSGTSVYGLGLCSSMGTGLWDIAWFRGFLWLWVKCKVPGDDVLLDRMDVLSRSVVHFALGFDSVTSWGQGLVDNGAGDI